MSTIGSRIHKLRKKSGLTQQQVANRLNVVRTSISNWESGTRTPDAESLSKLADLFGVTTDYLLGKESKAVSQEHLTNINNQIKNKLGEDVSVMFKDINQWDEEKVNKLKTFYDLIKENKI